MGQDEYIRWFEELGLGDVPAVGGKNASLGELINSLASAGLRVPGGFATTAAAYRAFIEANGLRAPISRQLDALAAGRVSLAHAGRRIRQLFLDAELPDDFAAQVRRAYRELSRRSGSDATDVAVRSSATAEDLPEASFAGQQESFLNIRGEDALLDACRRCFASLFTDRAIAYRQEHRFDHLQVALSVGVQKMVRSDLAGAGVMFTIDTESGFPDVVVIDAAWGLGESVVQGTVSPDSYTVFKPLLESEAAVPIIARHLGGKERRAVYSQARHGTIKYVKNARERRERSVLEDSEILELARSAAAIEGHYGRPMDIEWAKDGETGDLYIVQARPETVQARHPAGTLTTYRLTRRGRRLVSGVSIGDGIAAGEVRVVRDTGDAADFPDGAVLVTEMTNPDWVPILRRASAVVTDRGGRTCHAAIVSREFGIPALVGAGSATRTLRDGQPVTVSCAEGDRGYVYEGILEYEGLETDLRELPATRTEIMLNIAEPAAAFRWWQLPVDGIGLARIEFIITNSIQVHPMALVRLNRLKDRDARAEIRRLTRGYADRTDYFVDQLAYGVARIAASRYPRPVIVRTSDFKTNEYADLIGGREFEPEEENPMLGFRGASRYYSPRYRDGFALECRALDRVRREMGLTNVVVMIPFCRTVREADLVLDVMAKHGLRRGEHGLRVYMMCEIPSNVILASEFARRFDGFSIGSNDLTQLVLGVDRDSADLADVFDERDEAVKQMIRDVIAAAHEGDMTVGICGQAPSDYPEYAEFLVEAGIDSISLNPDSVVAVKRHVADVERRLGRAAPDGHRGAVRERFRA